jgi:phosphoserine phosphatase
MYLGDSENDNPAFRKADVSIGVRSDERLNPYFIRLVLSRGIMEEKSGMKN